MLSETSFDQSRQPRAIRVRPRPTAQLSSRHPRTTEGSATPSRLKASNLPLREQSHRIRSPAHQTPFALHAGPTDNSNRRRGYCGNRGGTDDSKRASSGDYQKESTRAGLGIWCPARSQLIPSREPPTPTRCRFTRLQHFLHSGVEIFFFPNWFSYFAISLRIGATGEKSSESD